jgi:hypothetical protein
MQPKSPGTVRLARCPSTVSTFEIALSIEATFRGRSLSSEQHSAAHNSTETGFAKVREPIVAQYRVVAAVKQHRVVSALIVDDQTRVAG